MINEASSPGASLEQGCRPDSVAVEPMETQVRAFITWARDEAKARDIPISSINVSFWSFWPDEVRVGISLVGEKSPPDASAPTLAEAMEKARVWIQSYKPLEEQISAVLGLHLLKGEAA